MSEPVTNVEIEDVLSSIRRLVSDEARSPIREREDVAFHSDEPPQPVEIEEELSAPEPESRPKPSAPALVLTPALRVETTPEEGTSDVLAETGEDSGQAQEGAPVLILSPEAHAQDAPEDIVDAEPQAEPVEAAFEHVEPAQEEVAEPMAAEPAAEEQPHHDESESEATAPDAEHDASDDAEDMSAPAEELAPREAQSFEAPQDEEHAQEIEAEEQSEEISAAAPEHDEPQDIAEAAQEDEPKSIEAKIAALEALIGRSDGEFEPDGAEVGGRAARAANALPWEDSNERRVAHQPDQSVPNPDEASQSAQFSEEAIAFQRAHAEAVTSAQEELDANVAETLLESEDVGAVLDEDALRDMVSEIVRQELQGPLGERITRNVRKLVRREIYRALAANELD